jgi:hypothetical protein
MSNRFTLHETRPGEIHVRAQPDGNYMGVIEFNKCRIMGIATMGEPSPDITADMIQTRLLEVAKTRMWMNGCDTATIATTNPWLNARLDVKTEQKTRNPEKYLELEAPPGHRGPYWDMSGNRRMDFDNSDHYVDPSSEERGWVAIPPSFRVYPQFDPVTSRLCRWFPWAFN